MKLSSHSWLALALAPLLGCSAVTTDAFDEAVDGAIDDTSTADAQDSGQPSEDTSVPPPQDVGVLDTGVVSPDTAVAPDTRPDTAPDTRPDALVTSVVQCASSPTSGTTCSGGQHCCITTTSSGSRNFSCMTVILPGTCTGVDLACDSTSDCAGLPGNVCCGALNTNPMGGTTSVVTASSCLAASQCTQMNGRVILCNPSQPNVCPTGRSCKQSTGTLPGYYLCLQ